MELKNEAIRDKMEQNDKKTWLNPKKEKQSKERENEYL